MDEISVFGWAIPLISQSRSLSVLGLNLEIPLNSGGGPVDKVSGRCSVSNCRCITFIYEEINLKTLNKKDGFISAWLIKICN